jgi:putative spermidine/putrescine transport system ATP-binding protein
VGTPQTLYDQPADPFTASFLGEINRLEGTVIQQTGNEVKLSLNETETLIALSDRTHSNGTKLNCYLRPERLLLKNREVEAEQGVNCLDGEVIQKLFFGNRLQYRVQLKNESTLNVQVPHGKSAVWEEGDSLSVNFAYRDVYLFTP